MADMTLRRITATAAGIAGLFYAFTALAAECARPGLLTFVSEIMEVDCREYPSGKVCIVNEFHRADPGKSWAVGVREYEMSLIWRVEVLGLNTTRWWRTETSWVWMASCPNEVT